MLLTVDTVSVWMPLAMGRTLAPTILCNNMILKSEYGIR